MTRSQFECLSSDEGAEESLRPLNHHSLLRSHLEAVCSELHRRAIFSNVRAVRGTGDHRSLAARFPSHVDNYVYILHYVTRRALP